jgi:hypothetical protein
MRYLFIFEDGTMTQADRISNDIWQGFERGLYVIINLDDGTELLQDMQTWEPIATHQEWFEPTNECDNFGCDKPDRPCPECKPNTEIPVIEDKCQFPTLQGNGCKLCGLPDCDMLEQFRKEHDEENCVL